LQEPRFIEYLGEQVVVLGHHNADPDAVGAAQGVKELVEILKQDIFAEIVMPEDISSLSMKIINELELDVKEVSSKDYDTLIVVDSGGLNQLGKWKEKIEVYKGVKILIDHHTLDDQFSNQFDLIIHDEDASSTCELVYRLYEKFNTIPTIKTSKALLAGITYDTKYLSLGSSMTFKIISRLLENVGDISDIRSMLQIESKASERIARLKIAQRSELHRIKEWVVVFSEVGSFHASGARALISLGADLAIVIGLDHNEVRASFRSTQSFHTRTDIHLGRFALEIGQDFNGSGSGHPTAAGFNGNVSIEEFKEVLLRKITEKIM
jgi:nanoRNase/pAp phosphatase (c-di-AMP/oligoRNAs hydrolase)